MHQLSNPRTLPYYPSLIPGRNIWQFPNAPFRIQILPSRITMYSQPTTECVVPDFSLLYLTCAISCMLYLHPYWCATTGKSHYDTIILLYSNKVDNVHVKCCSWMFIVHPSWLNHPQTWLSTTMAKLQCCPWLSIFKVLLQHEYDRNKFEIHIINIQSCKRVTRMHESAHKHKKLLNDQSQSKLSRFRTPKVNGGFGNLHPISDK